MENTVRYMLRSAVREIRMQREQNERMRIRLQAIDDCLSLMKGSPSSTVHVSSERHTDPLREIEDFLALFNKENEEKSENLRTAGN